MDDRQVIIFFKWIKSNGKSTQKVLKTSLIKEIIYHPGGVGEGAEHGQRSWLPYRVGRGDGGKFHLHLFFDFSLYFSSIFLSEWGMEECILLAFSSLFLNISPSLSFPQFFLFNDHSSFHNRSACCSSLWKLWSSTRGTSPNPRQVWELLMTSPLTLSYPYPTRRRSARALVLRFNHLRAKLTELGHNLT